MSSDKDKQRLDALEALMRKHLGDARGLVCLTLTLCEGRFRIMCRHKECIASTLREAIDKLTDGV